MSRSWVYLVINCINKNFLYKQISLKIPFLTDVSFLKKWKEEISWKYLSLTGALSYDTSGNFRKRLLLQNWKICISRKFELTIWTTFTFSFKYDKNIYFLIHLTYPIIIFNSLRFSNTSTWVCVKYLYITTLSFYIKLYIYLLIADNISY